MIKHIPLQIDLLPYETNRQYYYDKFKNYDNVSQYDTEIFKIALAGKTCYDSLDLDTTSNLNLEGISTDLNKYVIGMWAKGHGSVFEHISYSFLIKGISLVCSHELVRHRVGVAFSQQSGRYVRKKDLELAGFTYMLDKHPKMMFSEAMVGSLERHNHWNEVFPENVSLEEKKFITSTLRRLNVCGSSTELLVTFNLRAFIEIALKRTSKHAEQEIKALFTALIKVLCNARPYFKILWESVEKK